MTVMKVLFFLIWTTVSILAAVFSCLTPVLCLAQEMPSARYTEKSFLFLWPEQDERAVKLNLDDSIVTDRPDFTEASSTVGNKVTQLEMGYTYNHQDRDSEHSYPEVLLRQGMFVDWFEFRLGQNLSSLHTRGVETTGFDDLYFGAKLGIVPQHGILPEVALIPQMTLPTGAKAFGSKHVLPGLNLLYAWSLSDDSYLGASTQFNRADEQDDLYSEWAQSLTVGTTLNQNWGCYAEWFAFFPNHSRLVNDEHHFNTGLTYLLSNDIQADIRAGTGLNELFEQVFVGIGLSVRFFD